METEQPVVPVKIGDIVSVRFRVRGTLAGSDVRGGAPGERWLDLVWIDANGDTTNPTLQIFRRDIDVVTRALDSVLQAMKPISQGSHVDLSSVRLSEGREAFDPEPEKPSAEERVKRAYKNSERSVLGARHHFTVDALILEIHEAEADAWEGAVDACIRQAQGLIDYRVAMQALKGVRRPLPFGGEWVTPKPFAVVPASWTKVPPREPGNYWIRVPIPGPRRFIQTIAERFRPPGEEDAVWLTIGTNVEDFSDSECVRCGWEFWPQRIDPPPEAKL